MKYSEFIKKLSFGYTTAFVFDSPNNRYQYSEGEISDDWFVNAPEDGYEVASIDEFPEVKEVIMDNFVDGMLKPADGVSDDDYNNVKGQIESGKAQIGWWHEPYKYGRDVFEITCYILILD